MSQRKHYRVDGSTLDLSVSVLTKDGPVSATLLDASAGGARLRLIVPDTSEIEVGCKPLLSLTCHTSGATFEMPAEVRHVGTEEDAATIGVAFLDSALLEKHLPPAVFLVFNRRRSFRVRPAINDEILIFAKRADDSEAIPMLLLDISTEGLGAECNAWPGTPLARHDRVELSFSLPGVNRDFELEAVVRAVDEHDLRWRVSLALELEQRRVSAQQDGIMAYIMHRQHAQMRLAG